MSTITLLIAGFMILLSLVYALIKIPIAYSYGDGSAGGAPLLDGYIFPPIGLGFGSSILFRHFQVKMSGSLVGIGAFLVLLATYEIARRLGRRRAQRRKLFS